jgi:hypothetical protein
MKGVDDDEIFMNYDIMRCGMDMIVWPEDDHGTATQIVTHPLISL